MTDNQIVLPQQILRDYVNVTEEQKNALRWVGYLFVHNILSKQVPGFKPFLSKEELDVAEACGRNYTFDNMHLQSSVNHCVSMLLQMRLIDPTAIQHVDTFFDDMMKLESGVK